MSASLIYVFIPSRIFMGGLQVLSATDKKLNLGPSPEERTVYGGERHIKKEVQLGS